MTSQQEEKQITKSSSSLHKDWKASEPMGPIELITKQDDGSHNWNSVSRVIFRTAGFFVNHAQRSMKSKEWLVLIV